MLQELTQFKQRLLVGSFLAILLFICIYLSPNPYFRPFFALILASIVSLAVFEYYKIAKAKGFLPLERLGVLTAFCYVLAVFLTTQSETMNFLPETVLVLGGLFMFTNYFVIGLNPLVNTAITFFAIIYLALPLSTILKITYFFRENSTEDGRWWLLFLLLVTKLTDTGAYFVGKKFGKHKLAPYISPGKTWEGAVGGFFTALFGAIVLYYVLHSIYLISPMDLSLFHSVWLAGVLSVIAQFGDLAESLLKRDVGVKDSNQFPGFGGVLDLVDSLIFTAPLMYIFLKIQAA